MAERVSTGGVKSFNYEKGYQAELDEERKKNIQKGYEKYYERKKREKRNKIIIISIILIVLLVLGITFF